jgi:hypothetical protein
MLSKQLSAAFLAGCGVATTTPTPLTPTVACIAEQGILVRASHENTVPLYVGGSNVAAGDGFTLAAGDEVFIAISDPALIYVVSSFLGTGNSTQTVTTSGFTTGQTWTLSYGGQTTTDLAATATVAQVQAALQALSSIGAGNVLVTGSVGAYTVTFVGALAGIGSAPLVAGGSGTVTIAVTNQPSPGVCAYSWLSA